MGLIKLSLQSLFLDKVRAFFYFLTFVLTTIFIFLFFTITLSPDLGISLGKDDNTMVTSISIIAIIIAMICVFIANDFYVVNKGKEITVLLLAGASVYKMGFFLFIQSAILMGIAIPIGLLMGILVIPFINMELHTLFIHAAPSIVITKQAILAGCVIIAFEVFWCTYLNVGYCYRSSVQKLKVDSLKIEFSSLKRTRMKPYMWLILYIVPFPLFLINKDVMTYSLIMFIGLFGVFGVMKYIIPQYLNQQLQNNALENKTNLISFSFIRYDLKIVFSILLLLVCGTVLMMSFVIYYIDDAMLSLIALVAYSSVMILMTITMVAKLGMDIQTRKRKLQQLLYLGYTRKQLKTILFKEISIFYSLVLCLPFLYEIVIIIKVVSIQQITLSLGIVLVMIQIVPTIVGYLITLLMYDKQLPNNE